MTSFNEIIADYTSGKKTVTETKDALNAIKSGVVFDYDKNVLTEEEIRQTVIGAYADMANGYGLLDTGTGSLDKVKVKNGQLVDCDCGDMYAVLHIAGRMYKIDGKKLV